MTIRNASNEDLGKVLTGSIAGLSLVGSLFFKPLYLLVLIPFFQKEIFGSETRLFIVFSAVIVTIWLIIKASLTDSVNYGLIYSIFPWVVMGFFIIRSPDENFVRGIFYVIALLFLIDFAFNAYSVYFGIDPLGREPSVRADGLIDRRGGLMAHSFFSIVISITFAFLVLFFRANLWIGLPLVIINIASTGAWRGILYILFFLAFWALARRKQWIYHILFAVVSGLLVFLVTWLSTLVLDFGSNISNEFRVKAWINSLEMIMESPLLGSFLRFYEFDQDIGVEENNMRESGTTESALLGDLLRWGFPVIAIKLIVFTKLIKRFKEIEKDLLSNGVADSVKFGILQFIPVFVIFDYMIGSASGSVLLATITALLIATGLSIENHKEKWLLQRHI